MARFITPFLLGLLVVTAPCQAAEPTIPTSKAQTSTENNLPAQAKTALHKAVDYLHSISTHGGYLWWYAPDMSERAGETEATSSQIWVQPPGTPTIGQALLHAYRATGDKEYLDAALDAAEALYIGQLESGGWDYLIDFDSAQGAQWYRRSDRGKLDEKQIARRRNVTTFDDNVSQSALRFLMEAAAVSAASPLRDDPRAVHCRTAIEYGLQGFLRAQYPSGAWPQRYNGWAYNMAAFPIQRARLPKSWPRTYPGGQMSEAETQIREFFTGMGAKSKLGYSAAYTLNDQSLRDCILTMLDAYRRYNKSEYLKAAKRAGDFLVRAQLPEPQAAWAQQYNFEMEPIWARKFEPPAVASAESAGATQALIELYLATGDEKYFAPVQRAVDWFKRSAIVPNQWARFYELTTNKPLYFTKDYRLTYNGDDTPTHYSFRGHFNVPSTIGLYETVKEQGRETVLKGRKSKTLTTAQKAARRKALEPRVRDIVADQDDQGRWIKKEQVQMQIFSSNIKTLAEYLENSE